MNNVKKQNKISAGFHPARLNDSHVKESKNRIEVVNEEELRKIEAYLEWEQEYYIIKQSYLLDRVF